MLVKGATVVNHAYVNSTMSDFDIWLFTHAILSMLVQLNHYSWWLKGLIINIPALVQIMAWHLTGNEPLPEAVFSLFADANSSYIYIYIYIYIYKYIHIYIHINIYIYINASILTWFSWIIVSKRGPRDISCQVGNEVKLKRLWNSFSY